MTENVCPAAADLVAFLQRSAAALKDDGMLFVKENVTDKGFIVDNSDASVTRHATPTQMSCSAECNAAAPLLRSFCCKPFAV